MPAPTAIKVDTVYPAVPAQDIPLPQDDDDDLLTDLSNPAALNFNTPISAETMELDQVDLEGRPIFAPAKDVAVGMRVETRKVRVPPHRFTPLKNEWPRIFPPIVEHLKLQIRMNAKRKVVEIRTSRHTTDPGAIQKAEDFLRAFVLGFDTDDAIALLRLDDLYIESFEVKDVKTLTGDHLSRAIGRIAGHNGKTKFAIENATKTRIVLADSKVHILGAYKSVQIARASVCNLIMGKQPGKVYNNLRFVAARMKERF